MSRALGVSWVVMGAVWFAYVMFKPGTDLAGAALSGALIYVGARLAVRK